MRNLGKLRLHKASAIIVAIIFVLILSAVPAAYADGNDNNGFSAETINIGIIIRRVGVTFGALGLAFSAIEFAVGDDQQAGRAKSRMIWICASIAALMLLPTVINIAITVFKATGWKPPVTS